MEPNPSIVRTLIPMNLLNTSHLTALLRHCQVDVLCRGRELFSQGDYDHQHLYLLSGTLNLTSNDKNGQSTAWQLSADSLEALNPIANQTPRHCRAVAISDCEILKIDSDVLDKIICWDQVASYLSLDFSYDRYLDEDTEWIQNVFNSNLFYKIPAVNISAIFNQLEARVVTNGEVILRQGELGNGCFFIKEGVAVVEAYDETTGSSRQLAELHSGECFGEDALLNDTVRNATVTMKSHGVLMFLGKNDFFELLREEPVGLVDAAELSRALSQGGKLLDIRSQAEYEQNGMRRAINMPLHLLRLKTRMLSSDTDYIVYCDTQRRSSAACQFLHKLGFQVRVLKGGIAAFTPQESDYWLTLPEPHSKSA